MNQVVSNTSFTFCFIKNHLNCNPFPRALRTLQNKSEGSFYGKTFKSQRNGIQDYKILDILLLSWACSTFVYCTQQIVFLFTYPIVHLVFTELLNCMEIIKLFKAVTIKFQKRSELKILTFFNVFKNYSHSTFSLRIFSLISFWHVMYLISTFELQPTSLSAVMIDISTFAIYLKFQPLSSRFISSYVVIKNGNSKKKHGKEKTLWQNKFQRLFLLH